MEAWMIISLIWLMIVTLVMSWSGIKVDFSAFQLRNQDKLTLKDSWELKTRAFWLSLQLLILLILVIFQLLMASFWLKLWQSMLLALGLLLLAKVLANFKLVINFSNKNWQKLQLKTKDYFPNRFLERLLVLNSIKQMTTLRPNSNLASVEELKFLLKNSQAELGELTSKSIIASLKFNQLVASDLMVKIKNTKTIKPNDVLGPLVINELHETGQKFFPVMIKQQVVGVITLKNLIQIGDYQTKIAENLMDREFLAVSETASLRQVLKKMLAQEQAVAIVRRNSLAVGIVSLDQIVVKLLGA